MKHTGKDIEEWRPEEHLMALKVGYCFTVVPKSEVDFAVAPTGRVVRVAGCELPLYRGATYEDSRRVDAVMDRYGEIRLSDHEFEQSS